MKLNLTIVNIEKLVVDYEKFLKQYYTSQGFDDSTKKCGVEHYKLFMAISKQLNNIKILEIGSHHGNSAVALSYGKLFGNNIDIETYDIVNLLQDNPKKFFEKHNVKYNLKDLFDHEIREKNKNNILSKDIIFIDIDPHEGILEYDMLIWLKENNYKGIILFDDIKLGLGHVANNYRKTEHSMIDFWNKIDNKYKIDLTPIGHWSGTGLVSFNLKNHEIII